MTRIGFLRRGCMASSSESLGFQLVRRPVRPWLPQERGHAGAIDIRRAYSGSRLEIRGQPAEHPFPAVGVVFARGLRVAEAFVPDDDAGAAFDRFEAPGDGRDAFARVPVVTPGLDELAWRVDVDELAVHRERLAVASDAVRAPGSADAHVAAPLRRAVRVFRAPPARQL